MVLTKGLLGFVEGVLAMACMDRGADIEMDVDLETHIDVNCLVGAAGNLAGLWYTRR